MHHVSPLPRSADHRAVRAMLMVCVAFWILYGESTQALRADQRAKASASSTPLRCGERALPDDGVCVALPRDDEEGPLAVAQENMHRERSGQLRSYAQIPKRAERPEAYDAYRYPIPPGLPGGQYVVSGYDLDLPDAVQRRGPRLRAVGHGGVDLPQARGTPVALLPLEHQQGDAEVLYVGPLFGTTVLTRHRVREGGGLRDYVVLFGHLAEAAPDLAPGRLLEAGHVLGGVGDTGSPQLVHLHLETRRVREGVDIEKAVREGGGGRVLADAMTIVCDPRNVLPLAAPLPK
jgi:murein DD-endopeptidase MepM/ murein hydrolase activator NlpD